MRHAFVVGCPRSGTSWVRNILDQHPRVKCGPESHLFTMVHGVVSSTDLGAVPWRSIMARYDDFAKNPVGPHRWIDRDRLAGLVETAASAVGDPCEAADDLIAAVFAHYAAHNRLPDDTVLVEKTPSHLFHAERILRTFPDAQIIEVRRDGRDVCVSMERRALRVDWPPKDRREQITTWCTALSEGLRMSTVAAHASRWHVVRYEDLLTNRAGEIAALFTSLNLEVDADLLRRVIAETHISRVKRVGDGEHVRNGETGDWRTYFDREDIAMFFELAGDVFEAAGYRE